MTTVTKNSNLHLLVEQTVNNTTTWVGHQLNDDKDMIAGQTFMATQDADVAAIEIFSNVIATAGKVFISLYSFDAAKKTFGTEIIRTSVDVTKSDTGKWISFDLSKTHLHKGESYGFKIECADAYIGIGEAVGSHRTPPFISGQEWRFIKNNLHADAYSFFSLAFKVSLQAA